MICKMYVFGLENRLEIYLGVWLAISHRYPKCISHCGYSYKLVNMAFYVALSRQSQSNLII
jgi:hypothetical protein